MTKLPSTKALRAFEAAARLGSLKAAADHLSITPSALSRRIQALEEELGRPLFHRDPRGVALTETGRDYAARLGAIFRSLADATDAARASKPQRIRFAVPDLIGLMVMTRLKEFEALHPGVEVTVDISFRMTEAEARQRNSDLVVSFLDGDWAEWESVTLAPQGLYTVPMGTPALLPYGPLDEPDALSQFTWVRLVGHEFLWDNWCSAAGVPGLRPKGYFEVNSGAMAHNAAVNGMGLWLSGGMRPALPTRYLTQGMVMAHSFHAFFSRPCYHLLCRPEASGNPLIAAFRDWLVATFSPRR